MSNGIDLSAFNPNLIQENYLVAAGRRLLCHDDNFIVLCLGRLTPDLGIDELVKTFSNLKFLGQSKLVLIAYFDQNHLLLVETKGMIEKKTGIVQLDRSDHLTWDFQIFWFNLLHVLISKCLARGRKYDITHYS